MSTSTNPTKKRRFPTASSPHESDEDNGVPSEQSAAGLANKRRGSVAADFAAPRLIVSERQQMAVLKQLTAGEESSTGSHSPSSVTPQPRPLKINRRNEHGETIVHIVARKGDIKQLKKLLKAGANVNEADNAGWTPLHEAVTKNQFKAARLLLKSGANANAPGPEGQTPLVDAILNNNTKMAELLLSYSADPSVVDVTRLDETMSKVLKRELSVLDSSDNENDDESTSPLSPLTSDNDGEQEDKQSFHTDLVEQLDKNLALPSTVSKFQHKKPYRGFRELSSHSSDSSSPSKTRTFSATNDPSSGVILTSKNPYDFESDDEDEMHENSNDGEPKKTSSRLQRTLSGNSTQSNENFHVKKRATRIDPAKDADQKFKSISDDEQLQHIYRVPPLKIVLARAILQKTPDDESLNSPSMDDDDNTTSLTIDTSSITIPIIEENDRLFASMSTNLSRDREEKVIEEHPFNDDSSSHLLHLDSESNPSLSYRSHSPETIVSHLLESMLKEIETNENQLDVNIQLNSLPIVEDDQLEIEEDEDEDEENDDEEDDEEQDNPEKLSANKTNKSEKDRAANRSSKSDLKPTTRTLRSHARKKPNLADINSNSSSSSNPHARRVSNRRRALENKILLTTSEKERKRKSLAERARKEKDFADDNHASSNSDDQTIESTNEKVSNPNDDASSCSSTGAGDGESSTSSSTNNPKPSNDMEFLPPNKRRLREKNPYVSANPTEALENSPTEPAQTTVSREIPVNGIKQFLEIRHQIDKRHETMLNEFVLPKIPKDFSETTMAKKSYLTAPTFSSYMSTTPASIGIKRYASPHDLDPHLVEVFSKQEDERYRMKLRHQVERDKLILSHEQEVLRLCGNATRSSANQEIPFSYCSLLKDNEVYNNPPLQLSEKLLNNEYAATELGKRGKHRWNGRSFIKWLEDSNLKYKRLSCELNERQRLEADTLYSMQRMVWLKHLPKEASNLSASGRSSYLLSERYLPKVEINPNFWSHWETNPF